MFEPEELMARIVDLEEQLKVSEMAPPAAEQLIACLEGEIAKRDEELAACRVAVENCEVFRARIVELEDLVLSLQCKAIESDDLRAELSALKAQEPVEYQLRALIRDVTNIPEAGYYMPQSWHDQVIALSLSGKLDAPVSKAKAKGVVMPERKTKADYGVYIDEFADEAAAIYNRCLDEVARINAAPVQRVSVPDERIIPTSAELIQWAWEEEPEETRFQEGYNAAKRWVKMQIEAGIAAPEAPAAQAAQAADAGHVFYGMDGNHP